MHEYDGCSISFGGGVNSTAMTIMLVDEGWRGPIVFADTGTEYPETLAYIAMFEQDWLVPRGLAVTRLQGEPYRRGKKTLPLLDYCEHYGIWPSMFQRWCTTEWKIQPLERWAKAHGSPERLVGIDAGESHRVPDAERPLCNRQITRRGCIDIIRSAGLPVPHKSGCYMCMFQSIAQWRRLWEQHPDLFERVARVDDAIYQVKRHTLLLDRRDKPILLRTLAHGFATQLALPDLDTGAEHLHCWACAT